MRSISRRASRVSRTAVSTRAAHRAPRLTAGAAWAVAVAAAVLLATACGAAAKSPAPAATPAGTAAGTAAVTSSGPGGRRGTAPAEPTRTGPTGTGPTRTVLPPGGQPCDPRLIGPLGASFTSASDGYLLGVTLSECAASTASKVVLRKTADGGLHWTALPAPPAPWGGVAPDGTGHIPADGVTSVLFADARDGWAYGPGLWATHDGGATWHQLSTGGRAVQSMTATAGQAMASLESCDPQDAGCDGPQSWVVQATAADRDAWRPVPGAGAGGTGAGGTGAGPVLTAQAGTGYAVSPAGGQFDADVAMLTGPADGSARWVSRPLPCRPGAIALTAETAARLLLACALLGAHPATTYLYASSDAGQHWQRFAVLGLYDGASTIAQAPGGPLLVAGIYDGVELSRDGGRTWTRPIAIDGSLPVLGGGSITADLFTSQNGYVIRALGPLWITRDAGQTWTQVPVR